MRPPSIPVHCPAASGRSATIYRGGGVSDVQRLFRGRKPDSRRADQAKTDLAGLLFAAHEAPLSLPREFLEARFGRDPGRYQISTFDSLIIRHVLMVRQRCIRGGKIVHAAWNSRIPRNGCRFDHGLADCRVRRSFRPKSGMASTACRRNKPGPLRQSDRSNEFRVPIDAPGSG